MFVRRALLLLTVVIVAACGGGSPSPTISPAASQPAASVPPAVTPAASAAPTSGVTPAATLPVESLPAESAAASQEPAVSTPVPGSSLDPSLSDAGVVGRVTIANDTRGQRDGTHEIVGLQANGSDCSFTFEGDEFLAVAWYDDAPNGMIHQMGLSLPTDEVPANDGEARNGIVDGRVYIDFVSESGFGTAYLGDASDDDGGSVTINATMTGNTLVFDFVGKTWDAVDFSGQLMCAGMDI